MTFIPGKLILAKGYPADADVKAYVAAVEAADELDTPGIGALELEVIKAYDNFILGCKHDGIWDAIKASCILAGARTLSGALVPLVGTAPTNNGPFVAADYNRKTGLVGDGSTKYLDSNRNNNIDPQNNFHAATYASSVGNSGNLISTGAAATGATRIVYSGTSCRDSSLSAWSVAAGLLGVSRNNGSQYNRIVSSSVSIIPQASSVPLNATLLIFTGNFTSDARLAFYSIGEALDLALLDTRVSTLISDLGAAIP